MVWLCKVCTVCYNNFKTFSMVGMVAKKGKNNNRKSKIFVKSFMKKWRGCILNRRSHLRQKCVNQRWLKMVDLPRKMFNKFILGI